MSKIKYYNPKNNFPQESIGKEPNWILKSGISILAGTILIIVMASIFIKYPDRLTSSIVISTNSSPVKVSSLITGTIKKIYVLDGDTINKGDTLYYINKNEINLGHLSKVKKLLKLGKDSILNINLTTESFLLGDVQEYYQDFTQTVINYKEYLEYSPDSLQIIILKNTMKSS